MSNKHDKQYVAIAPDPETGNLMLVDYRKPEGQTYTILRPPGDLSRIEVDVGDIICPAGYQDALKISRAYNVAITAGYIVGGSEDVVDITDSRHVHVSIRCADPKGLYLATIKGGCLGVVVSVATRRGHGREVDFDLGNWFDYNQRTSAGISLKCDGDGVTTCRILRSERPMIQNPTNWRVYRPWWRWLFLNIYPLLKKLGL